MKKTVAILGFCLLTIACTTERQVVKKVSELEQRRLAIEIALAERVTKVEGVAETALATAQAADLSRWEKPIKATGVQLD